MKHLFTEKYIRGLENNKKDRLEIYDSFCPYLGCRIGKNCQKTYFVRKKYLGRNIRVTIGKTDEVGLEFARKKAFSLLEKIQKKSKNYPSPQVIEKSDINLWAG